MQSSFHPVQLRPGSHSSDTGPGRTPRRPVSSKRLPGKPALTLHSTGWCVSGRSKLLYVRIGRARFLSTPPPRLLIGEPQRICPRLLSAAFFAENHQSLGRSLDSPSRLAKFGVALLALALLEC